MNFQELGSGLCAGRRRKVKGIWMRLVSMCVTLMSKWKRWNAFTMNVQSLAPFGATSLSRSALFWHTLSQNKSKSGSKTGGMLSPYPINPSLYLMLIEVIKVHQVLFCVGVDCHPPSDLKRKIEITSE